MQLYIGGRERLPAATYISVVSRKEARKHRETSPPPQQHLPEATTLEEILLATQPKKLKTAETKGEIQEILNLFDERLVRGEVSEKTYLKVRARWEKKLKKENDQLTY